MASEPTREAPKRFIITGDTDVCYRCDNQHAAEDLIECDGCWTVRCEDCPCRCEDTP